jgi:hypothetical protein
MRNLRGGQAGGSYPDVHPGSSMRRQDGVLTRLLSRSQTARLPRAVCISRAPQSTAPPPACARFPGVKPSSRRTRIVAVFSAALAMLLVAAPAGMAENGVGLAGPTTDKMVTFFCFGVIAFFAILPIVLSLIQGRLEKRKEMRRSDLSRFS